MDVIQTHRIIFDSPMFESIMRFVKFVDRPSFGPMAQMSVYEIRSEVLDWFESNNIQYRIWSELQEIPCFNFLRKSTEIDYWSDVYVIEMPETDMTEFLLRWSP